MLDDAGHARLVEQYLRAAGAWTDIQTLDRSPRRAGGDPLYAVIGRAKKPQVPQVDAAEQVRLGA